MKQNGIYKLLNNKNKEVMILIRKRIRISILLVIAMFIAFLSETVYAYINNVFRIMSRHNLDIDNEKSNDVISNNFNIKEIHAFIIDIFNRLLSSTSRVVFSEYTSSLKLGEDYSSNKFNVPKFISKELYYS